MFLSTVMASYTIWLSFAILLCLFWCAESHVRFVCPRPASVRSDISFTNQSMGYCGLDMNTYFDRGHTEVRPGLFTLRFEETESHRHSVFRVSLHSADSDDFCVLLDHIPHNNQAVVSHSCALKGNEYPLGVCKGSTYYITVHIPDIECDRCYLRLVNILLDSADNVPCHLDNGTCQGDVSCASIKIRPSAAGEGRNISSCINYEDNLAGNWPYRPQDYYRVELGVGRDKVDPMLVFDSMHRTLHLDIPRHGFPTEIEEVQVVMNASILWNVTVAGEDILPDTVAVAWDGMCDDSIEHLKNGCLMLNIKCEKESFAGNISLQVQNYVEGQYTKAEKTEYGAGGWLVDYSFRGLYAEDLTVITPAGPCAPTPRYFISYLHPQRGSSFMHGILVASILGDYADITLALYGIKDITAITIQGSHLLGAPDLVVPVSLLKNSILQVSLDISKQIPFIDTVQFLKTVMVTTADPAVSLSGSFEEGMYAILRAGREVKGIGAFQFTKGQWLKYEVLMTGLESDVGRIELSGGRDVVYNMSHSVWHLTPAFCLVEGLVQDLSSKLLLRLWQGRLLLTAYTNSSTLQGTVTAPGSVYCRDARYTACFSLDITLDGMPETQGLEKVPPSGKAVFLLDGAKVLQYSIEINNLDGHPRLLEADVRDGEDLVFTIKLAPDRDVSTTYTATNHLQVSQDLLEKLADGGMKLQVFPLTTKPPSLHGRLPPITDHLCVQPRSVIVGEHRGYWSPEAAPFQTLFTIVGDSLTFKYDGNVSLFSFPSKEEMLSCNFTNASQVGPEAVNDTQVTYIVPLHSVMSLYFASQGHCNNTPPLRLSVNVIQPVPPSVGDSTDKCGALVFSDWRQQRLDAYSGPTATGPAVAGLVLGTLIALAFFFWDRRLRQKADIAVPGSRFQRF